MFPTRAAVLPIIPVPNQLPNNDSFIDIASPKKEDESTTTPRQKKSVRINESPPEIFARSPSQGSDISITSSLGERYQNGDSHPPTSFENQENEKYQKKIQLTTISETSSRSPKKDDNIVLRNENSINCSTKDIQHVNPHKYMIQPVLTPFQYVLIGCTKLYNVAFLLAHLVLHAVILAILCYTVARISKEDGVTTSVDGFTIFLFITTILQLLTVTVGILTSKGLEIHLQIYAVITGLSTISATVSTFLWCFLFEKIISSMKVTSEGLNTNASHFEGTTLVSFFDIFQNFYTVIVVLQFVDLGGLLLSLGCIYYRLKHMYSLLPEEKITWRNVLGIKDKNEEEKKQKEKEVCEDFQKNGGGDEKNKKNLKSKKNDNNNDNGNNNNENMIDNDRISASRLTLEQNINENSVNNASANFDENFQNPISSFHDELKNSPNSYEKESDCFRESNIAPIDGPPLASIQGHIIDPLNDEDQDNKQGNEMKKQKNGIRS